MKTLPIMQNTGINNYSANNYNKNICHKNSYINNVSFRSEAQTVATDAIKNVNINDVMLNSNVLIENLKTLLQREKELRSKIDTMSTIITERIGGILADNGFNPNNIFKDSTFYKFDPNELDNFSKLMKTNGGKTVREERPGWNYMTLFEARLSDNPGEVLTQVEHRLPLKSNKYPDSNLEIFAARTPDGYKRSYWIGIHSYKDKEYDITSAQRNLKQSTYNRLILNNPEIETSARISGYEFYLRALGYPITDKVNNVKFNYVNSNLYLIESCNDNTSYELFQHIITQKFPDKTVIHHLSNDLNSTESVEFRRAENR